MVEGRNEHAEPVLRVDGCQPFVFGDGFIQVALLPVGPGQDVLEQGEVVRDHAGSVHRAQGPEVDLLSDADGFIGRILGQGQFGAEEQGERPEALPAALVRAREEVLDLGRAGLRRLQPPLLELDPAVEEAAPGRVARAVRGVRPFEVSHPAVEGLPCLFEIPSLRVDESRDPIHRPDAHVELESLALAAEGEEARERPVQPAEKEIIEVLEEVPLHLDLGKRRPVDGLLQPSLDFPVVFLEGANVSQSYARIVEVGLHGQCRLVFCRGLIQVSQKEIHLGDRIDRIGKPGIQLGVTLKRLSCLRKISRRGVRIAELI